MPDTASAFGSFRVDYDNEKWSHDGFDDDNGEWGDNGELGVVVNLSNADELDLLGSSRAVDAGHAIDTFQNVDEFSTDLDGYSDVRAFRLTNAQDYLLGGKFAS